MKNTCSVYIFVIFLCAFVTSVVSSELPGGLSLAEAVDIMIANNIDMQNERLNLELGQSVFRAAKAPWTPRISLSSDTIYSRYASDDAESNVYHQLRTDISKRFALTGATLSLYSNMAYHDESDRFFMEEMHDDVGSYSSAIGLSIHQPLIKNVGPWNDKISLQRNRFVFENALYRFAKTQQRMILDVIVLYFNTMKQEKLLDVALRSVRDAEMHQQNTQIKLEEGLVAQMDVSQAELQLARQQISLIRSQQNTESLFDTLKLVLNMPLDKNIVLSEPIDYSPEHIDTQKAIKEAVNQRLEIRVLNNEIFMAEQAVKQAFNQRLPALDLVLNAESSNRNDRFADTLRFNDEKYDFRVGFSYTFGDRTDRELWTQSEIQLRKLKNELEHRMRSIEKEVRDEIRHYNALIEASNVSAQSLSIAEKNLELATESYREGLTGNLDLIKAQDDLITAGTSYYSDVIDLAIAKARILYVLGRKIDPDNLTLEAQSTMPVYDENYIQSVSDSFMTLSGEVSDD